MIVIGSSASADSRVLRRGLRCTAVLTSEWSVGCHVGCTKAAKANADDNWCIVVCPDVCSTFMSAPSCDGEIAGWSAGVYFELVSW